MTFSIANWLRGYNPSAAGVVERVDTQVNQVLTPGWKSVRLDRVGKGDRIDHILETHWDDALIEEQFRRYYFGGPWNGS